VERLVAKLAEALRVERRRRPTRPTAASRERRLAEKRRRADVKRRRAAPGDE
jgi:ribosome-associated protein